MKTYLCIEKTFYRNRLHYEGMYYKYPDSVKVLKEAQSKDGRPYFQEVDMPEIKAKDVEDGGLGPGVVNPAPDKRKPKIIDTTEEKEPVRPARSQVKTGLKATKKE